jgi:hypothetical protein
MTKSVVLYPGLGIGHLTPMVELAKVFLQHGAAVTVALVEPPIKSPEFSAAVARAAASNPSVTFHVLPPPPQPAAPAGDSSSSGDGTIADRILKMFNYLRAMCAPLRDFLRSLPAVDALVLDMFCGDALDVAAELKLPVYYFYASAATALAVFVNFARTPSSFEGLGDAPVSFPGAPPLKASDFPKEAVDGSPSAKAILRPLYRIPEADGILVNTFESLETQAVRALRDGVCVPDHSTPPVYCIGPLVSGGGEKEHECLRWLDTQPDSSVVFLSFGSMGAFPKKQLEEIANGLERSGQKFLWVVRSPRNPEGKPAEPLPEPDLDALLPQGFLERTKGFGLVVKSWAPQVDVLRHRATGAFVTHCGWNSTLEGIVAGLPLLCWPMYAEQRMNKVFLVEEMKLGVEMKGYDEEVVKAEEVETKVKWVMESEDGQALRERMAELKERAAEALGEGGSSHAAFVQFLKDLDT